jgi:hypothetical protein
MKVLLGIAALPVFLYGQATTLPWQTDWRKYVEEVAKQMEHLHPTSPAFDKVFEGKSVTWEGEVAPENKTRKPGTHLIMKMPPVEIEVPVSIFPGGLGSLTKAKVTVTALKLRMTPALEQMWAKVPLGSRVRFRARLEILEVLPVVVSGKGDVWFLVHDAQPRTN